MRSTTERKLRPTRGRKAGLRPRGAGKPDDLLYLQILRSLKDEIIRGVYPVGSLLPTEEELCARFSVSRYTVREALRRLRDDRLVASRRGAGTTVVPPMSRDAYVHEVTSFNDLITYATGVRFQIDTMEMIAADARLALRIGGAAPWVEGLVPAVIARLTERHPRIKFQVTDSDGVTLCGMLRERKLDFVIGRVPKAIFGDDLVSEFLFDDCLHVVAGADSHWSRRRRTRRSTIAATTGGRPRPASTRCRRSSALSSSRRSTSRSTPRR